MIQIRNFESGDAEAVKQLIGKIMDDEFQEEKAVFSSSDLDAIPQSYGKSGEAFFIAEDGNRVVGTVGIKREDDRVALVRRIFVDPQYRNQKIGYQLLDRAVEFCEERGYRELVFKTTSRMTGAIELFKKKGFQSRAKVPMGEVELLKFVLSLARKSVA